MPHKGRLRDRIVIVTGAGSSGPDWGTGKAIAVLAAREGAHLVVTDVNEANAHVTADLVRAEGGECLVSVGDATCEGAGQVTVERTLARFGRIDVLINNLGVGINDGSPADIAPADWDCCFAGNVRSMFLMTRAVLPTMIAQGGGSIVNLSSIQALRAMYYIGGTAYSASKAAVHAFSRQVALHHAKDGVRSNVIVVGTIMSNMVVNDYRARGLSPAEIDQRLAERDARVPLGFQGSAFDIAHAALYLASDDARFVTAAELVVDGGLSARAG